MCMLKLKSVILEKKVYKVKIRDLLIGLGTGLILLGAGGLWDLAVIKADWPMYPMPFTLLWLPRWMAADLFFALIVIGTIILLVL